MTSATPADGPGPSGIPLRAVTAWVLLALAGAVIAFGFLGWIFPPSRAGILERFSAVQVTGTTVLVAPLLAVLVATRLGRPLSQMRLIGLLALVEYLVALLLGSLAFLITMATRFDDLAGGIYAFGGILSGLGDIVISLLRLALLAVAALWTYQLFRGGGGRLPQFEIR